MVCCCGCAQIKIDGLQGAITRCEQTLQSSTAATTQLRIALRWCEALLRLRTALLSGDRGAMETVLRDCGSDASKLINVVASGPLAAVSKHLRAEFTDVSIEVDNITVLSLIKRGLTQGRVVDVDGVIDESAIGTNDLERGIAIAKSRTYATKSKVVALYYGTAVFVLTLRRLIIKGDWESAASVLVVSVLSSDGLACRCTLPFSLTV